MLAITKTFHGRVFRLAISQTRTETGGAVQSRRKRNGCGEGANDWGRRRTLRAAVFCFTRQPPRPRPPLISRGRPDWLSLIASSAAADWNWNVTRRVNTYVYCTYAPRRPIAVVHYCFSATFVPPKTHNT